MSALMAVPPNDEDVALMRRVKRGDRDAFAALVDRYRQPLLNLMYRMVHDAAEAEDLAQAAFVQVYRFARRYRENARFSTWLFTIARNLCLNELRRRARHPAEPLEGTCGRSSDIVPHQREDPRSPHPPDTLLQTELEQLIQRILDTLPPNQRLAVLLCRDEDLSYEDIGRILGCSLSATKSLIHRGRETLKQHLKPYLKTGAWDPPPRRQQL
jgi:RNA polymerase sigma-70 factor (ECF subfamily)